METKTGLVPFGNPPIRAHHNDKYSPHRKAPWENDTWTVAEQISYHNVGWRERVHFRWMTWIKYDERLRERKRDMTRVKVEGFCPPLLLQQAMPHSFLTLCPFHHHPSFFSHRNATSVIHTRYDSYNVIGGPGLEALRMVRVLLLLE